MTVEVPGETTRWRCARCGNLTRFDVLRQRRSREYWHFDLSGQYEVESDEPVKDEIEQVVCRWCGSQDAIELVPRPGAGGPEVESVS